MTRTSQNSDASDPTAHGLAAPAIRQAWHRRIVQALLYGRDVDRGKKAKARLGLAIAAFAVVYLVIAGRLVLYAVAPDVHAARRGGVGRRRRDLASRYSRPQRRSAGERRDDAVAVRRTAPHHRRG